MRRRSFEIIREPELVKTSFLFNNVEVWYVGTCPETGISFYCSLEHNYGVRVYPDGRKVLKNPTFTTSEGCKDQRNAKRKQRYLEFKDAFGIHKDILVSHAVWMADDRDLPEGMTIDHIDGCTTNNFIGNLRCMDLKMNMRDGGFKKKLTNKGFDPVRIPRHLLLIYFDRMAVIKPALGWRYDKRLNANDLHVTLFCSDDTVIQHFSDTYNLHLQF